MRSLFFVCAVVSGVALALICPLPSAAQDSAVRIDTAYVSMPDGPELLTEVYLPAAVPAPVIFARTPYGSRNLHPRIQKGRSLQRRRLRRRQ